MKTNLRRLCECAILIALSTVLSLIPIIQMPLGGKVTLLSMLPVCFIGLKYNKKTAFISAFVYSVIQLIFGITMSGLLGWGLSAVFLVGTIFFDYLIAYTMLGFSGFFKNKGTVGIAMGVGLSILLRFVCHVISGAIFFAEWAEFKPVILYSIAYNGAYLLPELILTVVFAIVLIRIPVIKKLLDRK